MYFIFLPYHVQYHALLCSVITFNLVLSCVQPYLLLVLNCVVHECMRHRVVVDLRSTFTSTMARETQWLMR